MVQLAWLRTCAGHLSWLALDKMPMEKQSTRPGRGWEQQSVQAQRQASATVQVTEYLGAGARQFGFMLRGLKLLEPKLKELNIPFFLLKVLSALTARLGTEQGGQLPPACSVKPPFLAHPPTVLSIASRLALLKLVCRASYAGSSSTYALCLQCSP